ncbi:MAG: nucleotide exchange factor GrpE [Kofleriaceae bacterium]|nr:nucleotide exchange factor GrpE [Kofleriaceae bacterium]MBP6838645.1 nucleotide exchange factor GrpE [Kofleriaceae bacterium]MBP9207745.1 nucleotide exchange factor GrpE [Kofleriaceae bacterium]
MSTDEQTDDQGDGGIAVEVDAPASGDAGDDRVAQLEAELAALAKDKKDSWDKYLRSVADLENLRKRQKRELDDARIETRAKVLKEMLPVVDNLERAIEHAEQQQAGDASAIVDGVRLVLRQFTHAFERLEVTPIEAKGQAFDPNLHEAISQQETNDAAPGTVLTVLQRGYKNGDRLLRPALVVVAKPKAEGGPETAA